MYLSLLVIHSLFRWVVAGSLLYATYRAWNGVRTRKAFSIADNAIRHWTATIVQVQMVFGMVLYFQSPFVKTDTFFTFIHPILMLIGVIVISVGSATAKRKPADDQKFRTMLTWFSAALVIILISVPWPFSPLAQRPYLRIP